MGMTIDGIASCEHIDSSSEVVDLKGLDISSLTEGKAVLNAEHRGPDHAGFSFNDHIGRISYAKKIFKREDAGTDRQKMYWDKVEVPYLYIQSELFDDDGHPGAIAAAAEIRHYKKRNLPVLVQFSIEGSTLLKEGNRIVKSMARCVAATIRPANKACYSDVVYDPIVDGDKPKSETEDALRSILGTDTKKFERPDAIRLGVSPWIGGDPEVTPEHQLLSALQGLRKTYGGAPGTQVNSAALERPTTAPVDHKAKAKAALRDYDPHTHGPFKSYAKAALPEASDEFLNHFTDLVDSLSIQGKLKFLRKAEEEVKEEPEKPKVDKAKEYKKGVRKIKAAHKKGDPEAPAIPPSETPEFQIRKRKTASGGTYFDEDTGVVHFGGKDAANPMKLYIPSKDDPQYNEILHDPHLNAIHDHAIANWYALHKLARSGQLPDDVIAHAAMFSAMSPNTAVPVQELAYGHIQDFADRGFDPAAQIPPEEMSKWAREFLDLSKGRQLPAYMNDHYAAKDSGAWTKASKKAPSQVKILGLESGKMRSVAAYPNLHQGLVDAFRKHGADARAISGEINARKASSILESKRKSKKVEGDEEDAAAEGTFGAGFAPKTIRYLLGMVGMGNSVVPDTHFLRHSFGLMLDDPKVQKIKATLWKAQNDPLLQGIDRYYYKHHPAVQHTREKILKQHGEDLGEQAIFPGFWLHWLTVAPHERARGWENKAANAGTDHAVYWNSIKRILEKYKVPYDKTLLKSEAGEVAKQVTGEDPWADGGSMPARTAHAVKEIENQFGETPAQFAFYAYMVPALLRTKMTKGEILAQSLMKAVEQATAPLAPAQAPKVAPQLAKPAPAIKAPESASLSVDAAHHGLPHLTHSPEQADLLHGVDLNKISGKLGADQGSMTAKMGGTAGWGTSKAGKTGFIKSSASLAGEGNHPFLRDLKTFTPSEREASYHHMAKNVFGLGEHTPTTAAFAHPVTGEHHSIQEKVEGGQHYHPENQSHKAALHHLYQSGKLDKLALMDQVMSNGDRHAGNYMLTPGKGSGLQLIDNGLSFASSGGQDSEVPHYWLTAGQNAHGAGDKDWGSMGWMKQPLHPEANRWLQGLDPEKLKSEMSKAGHPLAHQNEAVNRLKAMQARAKLPGASKGSTFFAHQTSEVTPEFAVQHNRFNPLQDSDKGAVLKQGMAAMAAKGTGEPGVG